MTSNRKMTPEEWQEAEAMARRGTCNKEIARHFGISHGSVRQRAYAHDWQTPDRIARKQRKAERQGRCEVSPETGLAASKGGLTFASLGVDREALRASAQRGGQEFRAALEKVLRRALAESIAGIPLPRTIGEWAKMVDLLCKLERNGVGG